MNIIALLPMKAHSERVKRKNFKEIAGKPLFRWMLDKLICIDEIDMVVINTDVSEELKSFNIENFDHIVIEQRPTELRGDMVSMNLIIEHDIKRYDADIYLMTHTTNPALTIDSIKKAIKYFREEKEKRNTDSLFSVTKQQTRFYDKNAVPINHDPENLIRTQDLEPWYEENSNLYLFTKESFNETGSRIGKNPIMFETSKMESIDIDDLDDFYIAEAILNYQLANNR